MRSITLRKKNCPMLGPHPVEEDVALEAQQLEVYFIIEKPSCI